MKAQLKKLSELSERNAKHAYIEYCIAMPGYGAIFYEIRVIIVTCNKIAAMCVL